MVPMLIGGSINTIGYGIATLGSALGVAGDASPVLLDRITSWATGLEQRGIVLAPVTAILRRPEIPQKESAAR